VKWEEYVLVWYEIIDLDIMQVGQLSKNMCLFILMDLREKEFVSVAVVSDVLVALCKPCVAATLQVLLSAQKAVQALLAIMLNSTLLISVYSSWLGFCFYMLYVVLYI